MLWFLSQPHGPPRGEIWDTRKGYQSAVSARRDASFRLIDYISHQRHRNPLWWARSKGRVIGPSTEYFICWNPDMHEHAVWFMMALASETITWSIGTKERSLMNLRRDNYSDLLLPTWARPMEVSLILTATLADPGRDREWYLQSPMRWILRKQSAWTKTHYTQSISANIRISSYTAISMLILIYT